MFRPIANPGQNANNALKRYADDDVCCNSYPDACQYDVTIATANSVTAITYKRDAAGSNITATFSGVTGGANVLTAFRAALVAAGYENDADQVTDITRETSGSNQIYHITGGLIIVSATHSGGTATATAKCNRTGICDFYIAVPGGAANVFGVDGTDEDLGSLVIGVANAAAVKAAIEGAAAWPSGYTAAVTEDADFYYITLNGPGEIVFTWNGEQLDKQNCVAGYIA